MLAREARRNLCAPRVSPVRFPLTLIRAKIASRLRELHKY
jgi:hypothetical protein